MIQTRFLAVAVFALVLLAGSLFQNPGRQNARWTGPYFSAAANFQLGRGFSIDIEDVRHFCQLKDYDAEKRYRFRSSNDLSPYNANPFGYVYVILLATTLFGWFAADIESLLLLQILVHAAATVFVMMRLKSWAARVAFVAAYGINPLILHFVTLDFYFFWQVVPSLALITLHSKPQLRSSPLWLVWAAVLGIVLSVRPTTVGAVLLVFIGLWKSSGWQRAILPLAACLFVFSLAHYPHKKNVWHTAYIGVGAYSNPYMEGLGDVNGYSLMKAKTGVKLDIETGGNFYLDSTVDRYREVTREEYFRIMKESPLLLMKNALVNILGSFSLGYANRMPDFVNYGLALSGLVILSLLFSLRECWMILAIASTSICFAPYYPPIQAYMFGSFILLSFVAAKVLFDDHQLSRLARRLNNPGKARKDQMAGTSTSPRPTR